MPSLLAAVVAAVLIAASYAGRWPLAVALAVVQAGLIAGWFRAAGLTGRWQTPGAAVAVAAALAADLALLARHSGDSPANVRALTGVLAALVGAAFVVQLVRRDGRPRLTASLAATVATGALALGAAIFIGVRAGRAGETVVLLAMVAAGVSVLPVQRWLPLWVAVPLGLGLGVLAGVIVGANSADVGAAAGAALGSAAAALAVAARAGVAVAPVADGVSALPVGATLPLAVVAPAVLVIARIMVG